MDLSLITAAAAALGAARDTIKAASGVRDFNQMAAIVSQLNEQLLKAQDSLFAHNAQLLALQQDQFDMAKRLQKAEEKLAERDRYTLFEISDRTYVLRYNRGEQIASQELAQTAEPDHYICQKCFASGIKVVLQKQSFYGAISLECANCKGSYPTGEIEPAEL